MKLFKLFVIAINIFLLVSAIVLIGSASSPKFVLGDFYYILARGNDIDGLNLIWIASGFVLLAVGVFGLWSTLKESLFMINLYTVILLLTLILQVVTGATSKQLSAELDYIVSHSMNNIMNQYGYNPELTFVMDSIQKQYACCGYNGPADWQLLNERSSKKYLPTENAASRSKAIDDFMIIEIETVSGNLLKTYELPTSCCESKKCENYHSRGCFDLLYKDIAPIVVMVKSTAMISSVLQVFGILVAYSFGRRLQHESSGHLIRSL